MLKVLQSIDDWCCWVDDKSVIELPPIHQLLTQIDAFTMVLKDDRRSLVVTGELFGRTIVAKQPRDKNRRAWSRLLSRWRDAEAKKTLRTLLEFQQHGIASVTPICVLEKRRNKQVIDSWLLYEFRDGSMCTADDLPSVVAQLRKLHDCGYQHEDPNLGNFMLSKHNEIFLIDCKGNAKRGRFGAYYDFMLLSQRNSEVSEADVEALVVFNRAHVGYWLARAYSQYKSGRTALKERLKRRRSKADKGD